MKLNTIKPAAGSKREHLRVGRGASAGQGKTCGRGVKAAGPQGWLSQGRLRRRPDAAAAPHAEVASGPRSRHRARKCA